jgi:MFS family permease
LIPRLLFSLPVGVWLERVHRRRVLMIVCDFGRAVLLATIPIAYAYDALTITQLYAVAVLTGCFAVVFDIAHSTLFVSVTKREDYVEANSLLHGSRAFSFVAGPSVGGVLVQILNAPVALLADAASFVGSAAFLLGIRAPEPPVERTQGTAWAQMKGGLRFIAHSTILKPALLSVTTLNFFNFMFAALFILFATRELHVRAGTLGIVLGAGAVGGLIGAAIAGRLGRRLGFGPAFMVGMFLFPAPLILVPLAGGPRVLVLVMLFASEFLSGLGVMILDINVSAIMTALTPHRFRSRATAAFSFVNYGIRPIGSLIGGALGAAFGLRPILFLATVGGVAGILWLLPSPLPRLMDLPEEEEAAAA